MYMFSVYCMHTPIIRIIGNIEHKLKVSGETMQISNSRYKFNKTKYTSPHEHGELWVCYSSRKSPWKTFVLGKESINGMRGPG